MKDKLRVLEIYEDKLSLENNKLVLIANNKVEEAKLGNALEEINHIYHNLR